MAERPMLVEKEITVMAYDIDVVGVVSNIVYIRWFEDLRHLFLDKYYPLTEMLGVNRSPLLIKTEVVYKAPLTIRDTPVAKCWMSNIGRTKWEISFEISANDTIYCIGKQVGCFFDLEKKRPTQVPERILSAYQEEMKALISQ